MYKISIASPTNLSWLLRTIDSSHDIKTFRLHFLETFCLYIIMSGIHGDISATRHWEDRKSKVGALSHRLINKEEYRQVIKKKLKLATATSFLLLRKISLPLLVFVSSLGGRIENDPNRLDICSSEMDLLKD